jgi:glycosyltransferase involved in cell wall biosynthesis
LNVRVALDGSFLQLPPSGTGAYVRAMIDTLPVVDPELDVQVLVPDWENDSGQRQGRMAAIRNDRRVRRAAWELVGVRQAAESVHADLVHIPHFSAPLREAGALVVTIHDVIPLVLPEYRASRAMRAHLAIVRRTVRRARLILTPSEAAAHDIERVLGIPAERIRVTPEAAGPEYQPAANHAVVRQRLKRLEIEERYIFNVGGLDVRKNLPVLLEAFARARPQLSEPVHLVIAGSAHSGNPAVFPPLEPVIQRLGLSEHVILPGRVSEEEKTALYQGADLYVTPSLYEGFGLTALEAMASGVPVIAANRTSLPEVVGDAGLLVEPEPDALAEAMARVLTSPTLADDLRQRGLIRSSQFSWRKTAELTIAAYHEALEMEP